MSDAPYNPLDKLNLGKSVAEALLDREPHPLGELPLSEGAGIYAIYYRGAHPAYARLAEVNADEWRVPIYIGKAVPAGARRGDALFKDIKGRALYGRLKEHSESVKAAVNLDLADFGARWLVVDDIWIPLGETLLISRFSPVWNVLLDGFGNHDPGGGRYEGMMPAWDSLHPGRYWAPKMKRPRTDTPAELQQRVIDFLARQDMPDPHIPFAPAP